MEGYKSNLDKETNSKTNLRPEAKILNLFDTCRKTASQAPKKEYVRCKLIRGHKRAVRQIIAGQKPKTTIHKFDQQDSKSISIWLLLSRIIEQDLPIFEDTSKTESGPRTDGKSKRRLESLENSQRSFNGTFCKTYFQHPSIRESFSAYIDLIFSNFDPESLCEKFEFRCCREEKHSIECLEKWTRLMNYLKIEMIEELGLKPNEVFYSYVTLPSFTQFLEVEEEN